jgi:hypothetical protein
MDDVIQPERPSLSRRGKWIFGGTLAAIILPMLLHRGTLLDPIPFAYSVIGAALGFALGIAAVMFLVKFRSDDGFRTWIGLGILPFMLLFAATYYVRLAVETVAFAGFPATVSHIAAPVTGMGTSRKWPTYWAHVRPGGRELEVKVSYELYAQLDPYRSPGRDCLSLEVETGRGGIRRTEIPALFDAGIGEERLSPC